MRFAATYYLDDDVNVGEMLSIGMSLNTGDAEIWGTLVNFTVIAHEEVVSAVRRNIHIF